VPLKPQQLVDLARRSVAAWIDDYAPSMGAALAYYTLFSIAPLLLIVISIAGLVFGADAARGQIFAELRELMGEDGAAAVQSLLQSVNQPARGVLGTIIGGAVLLLGAMSVFSELQNSLDRIWRAPQRANAGLWLLVRSRLLSFGMVLGVGFLLIVSLVASAAVTAMSKFSAQLLGPWAALVGALDFALTFVFVTATFAMIYKVMPRVRIAWPDVWLGATVTALLFALGKSLIGLYLGRSSVASGYGAAGSLIVLLIWMYYSAQIFLLGAEFTRVYARTFGSLGDSPQALAAAPGDAVGAAADAVERSRAALAAALGARRGDQRE
jgi:membrane protein